MATTERMTVSLRNGLPEMLRMLSEIQGRSASSLVDELCAERLSERGYTLTPPVKPDYWDVPVD